jgi:hypothetical protein
MTYRVGDHVEVHVTSVSDDGLNGNGTIRRIFPSGNGPNINDDGIEVDMDDGRRVCVMVSNVEKRFPISRKPSV